VTSRALWISALVLGLVLAGVRGASAEPAYAKPAATTAVSTVEHSQPDKRRIVGILDVRVDGVPREIAERFQQNLEKQLDNRAYWLAPKARMQQMLANSTRWTEGCVVGTCLTEIRTQTNAELVLLATISGSDNTFGFVVTLVRTDNGRMFSQESDRCDVCTVDEVLSSATQAAIRLLAQVPDVLPDEAAATTQTITKLTTTHDAALASTKRRHKWVAIGTVLTGLAVAGTGAALYFVGDRSPYALATTAAGGGLLLGGMISLNF